MTPLASVASVRPLRHADVTPILSRRAPCSSRDARIALHRPGGRAVNKLLVIPFIGLLWVPFYNHEAPALLGFPFFYWYQLLWVPITAFIIWLVYRSVRRPGDPE
jgi:Protein of unknown function (DUF3311)